MRFSKLALVVKMGLAAVTLSVGFCAVNSAQAADVKWDDIRGVSSPVGVKDNNDPELNTVGVGTGVTVPGRRPWSTKSGKAKIDLRNGRLEFEVRGLVLGGGAFTGTTPTPPPHMVQGRLVCDTNGSLPG
ncbi:MAG TPA: hypothetical protein VK132_08785, partial [Gemmatimonadales bacterium]|nr:hypothetical protein [Gemmatimonadales bacterium]